MSVETFFTILLLIFFVALGGSVAGMVQAWPRGDRPWNRTWVGISIASTVVLVAVVGYVVLFYVSLVYFGENR